MIDILYMFDIYTTNIQERKYFNFLNLYNKNKLLKICLKDTIFYCISSYYILIRFASHLYYIDI